MDAVIITNVSTARMSDGNTMESSYIATLQITGL